MGKEKKKKMKNVNIWAKKFVGDVFFVLSRLFGGLEGGGGILVVSLRGVNFRFGLIENVRIPRAKILKYLFLFYFIQIIKVF